MLLCLQNTSFKKTKVEALPRTKTRRPREGVEIYLYSFFYLGGRWGGWQRHAPSALLLGKTRYPLYRRLDGPQGRSGRAWKILTPPGLDPRTVQAVASHYTDCAIPIHKRTRTVSILGQKLSRHKNTAPL